MSEERDRERKRGREKEQLRSILKSAIRKSLNESNHRCSDYSNARKEHIFYMTSWLPEAKLRCWLAQFPCNLFLQLMVCRVQRDRQSHGVCIVDLHHHQVPLCSLSFVPTLQSRSRTSNLKDFTGSLMLIWIEFRF